MNPFSHDRRSYQSNGTTRIVQAGKAQIKNEAATRNRTQLICISFGDVQGNDVCEETCT
jgi:hypothetical protein